MAIFAAEHYGCRVTTTTISRDGDYGVAAVADKGYRIASPCSLMTIALQGRFDKLVSIANQTVGLILNHLFRHRQPLAQAAWQSRRTGDHHDLRRRAGLELGGLHQAYIFPVAAASLTVISDSLSRIMTWWPA